MEKNIKVDEDIWKKLHQEKIEQGYNKISDLIRIKVDFVEKFTNEKQFRKWFENNYKWIGFSRLIKYRNMGFPDFQMEMDGKIIEVELETLSSNFIRHKHDPEKVDIVICILKDKELPVKTIEIKPFEFIINTVTTSFKIKPSIWNNFKKYCSENNVNINQKIEELITGEMGYENINNSVD